MKAFLPAGLRGRRVLPYLLILPSVIALLSLIIYPLFFSLTNSFYLWNLQTSPVPLMFVGWQNYQSVFTVTPFPGRVAEYGDALGRAGRSSSSGSGWGSRCC